MIIRGFRPAQKAQAVCPQPNRGDNGPTGHICFLSSASERPRGSWAGHRYNDDGEEFEHEIGASIVLLTMHRQRCYPPQRSCVPAAGCLLIAQAANGSDWKSNYRLNSLVEFVSVNSKERLRHCHQV